MSFQIEKQRSRRKQKGKFKIRVRYKYHYYKTIETEDYGSFREMLAKYKGKYEFWCADVPPTNYGDGNYSGVRLDSDIDWTGHEEDCLQRFGKNKCWIDETFKINGRKVCLVFNAGLNRIGYFVDYYQNHKVEIRDKSRERYWRIKREGGTAYQRMLRLKSLAVSRYVKRLRVQVIQFLGGKCVKCGIQDIRVLEIAHRNRDGFKDGKNRSANFYRSILNGKRAAGDLFVLCANHHKIHDSEEDVS